MVTNKNVKYYHSLFEAKTRRQKSLVHLVIKLRDKYACVHEEKLAIKSISL